MTSLPDTTAAFALESQTPHLKAPALRLVVAAPGRWRVVDDAGRIIGHLDAVADPRGPRYRARRYHPASRSFRDVGDFWSPDDATDTLRFAG